MRRAICLVFGFLLGSVCQCHPRPVLVGVPVIRGQYAYEKLSDTTYVVAAVNIQALHEALNEIGCGKGVLCSIDQRGQIFVVEQRK